jgi:hypothetical protein
MAVGPTCAFRGDLDAHAAGRKPVTTDLDAGGAELRPCSMCSSK